MDLVYRIYIYIVYNKYVYSIKRSTYTRCREATFQWFDLISHGFPVDFIMKGFQVDFGLRACFPRAFQPFPPCFSLGPRSSAA